MEIVEHASVDPALDLFAGQSLYVVDIATAVGVSQGAVFKHFATKEAIWVAAMQWVRAHLLAQLQAVRDATPRGLSLEALAQALRVDALQLEEPVAAMVKLDWLGRLDEDGERYVLLVDPAVTPLAPLMERLLLAHQPNTARFWFESHWARLTVAQALASSPSSPTSVHGAVVGPSVASG